MKSPHNASCKGVVCVVHYTPLTERYSYLSKQLRQLETESFWITEMHSINQSRFSAELKAFGVPFQLIAMDRSNNSRSLVKPRKIARIEGFILLFRSFFGRNGIRFLTDNPRPLLEDEQILQLTRMHVDALLLAFAEGYEWIIVLEDDALFQPQDFNNFLQSFFDNLKWRKRVLSSKPLWISIGSGANLKRTKFDSKPDQFGLFRIRPWASRCSSAYLVNRSFISHFLNLIEDFGLPNWTAIDVIFQIAQRKMKCRTFWQDHPLVLQGSEEGEYKSNLGHNARVK